MVPVVHLTFLFMSIQLIYSPGSAFDLYGCHGTNFDKLTAPLASHHNAISSSSGQVCMGKANSKDVYYYVTVHEKTNHIAIAPNNNLRYVAK